MTTWYNYEHYSARMAFMFDNIPLLKVHVAHCIEMLRQVLMCNADMGIIPLNWVKNKTMPVPDFNTWHKCRDFDSVLDFAKRRRLPAMRIWPPAEGELILDEVPLHP